MSPAAVGNVRAVKEVSGGSVVPIGPLVVPGGVPGSANATRSFGLAKASTEVMRATVVRRAAMRHARRRIERLQLSVVFPHRSDPHHSASGLALAAPPKNNRSIA